MSLFLRLFSILRKRSNLLALFFLMLFSGCVTNKMATYLQEPEVSNYSGEYAPPENYLIQTNDNLYIRVTTLDPSYSTIFNAMGDGGEMRADEASAQLMSYPVELDGTVDLPYVGIIEVGGLTLPEAKKVIMEVLEDYVTDASLTVKLVNNYVTLVGEVREPGLYPIYKERLNIYQALAMAGDVADYGNRYVLSVIRKQGEESIVKDFDITDRNVIDSEFYYVMPNDVLYVKPHKGRYFAINTAPYTFALATLSTAIGLIILVQQTIILQQ